MKSKVQITIEVDDETQQVDVTTETDPKLPDDTTIENAHVAGQLAIVAGRAINAFSKAKCKGCFMHQLDHTHMAADTLHDLKDSMESEGAAEVPTPTKH